eukprot:8302393-Pyramimonas_sp.AAC.1
MGQHCQLEVLTPRPTSASGKASTPTNNKLPSNGNTKSVFCSINQSISQSLRHYSPKIELRIAP